MASSTVTCRATVPTGRLRGFLILPHRRPVPVTHSLPCPPPAPGSSIRSLPPNPTPRATSREWDHIGRAPCLAFVPEHSVLRSIHDAEGPGRPSYPGLSRAPLCEDLVAPIVLRGRRARVRLLSGVRPATLNTAVQVSLHVPAVSSPGVHPEAGRRATRREDASSRSRRGRPVKYQKGIKKQQKSCFSLKRH